MARRGPRPAARDPLAMGGVSGKRAQAVPPAGGIGQRRLTLLAVYFAERLLFLGVNIVMPLRLASAGDIANAEIGLFYALLLVGYHGSPLFYSLLGRYATREQILILAVALELAALLLIIGGAVDNRLYRLALLAGLGAGGVSAMLNGLLAARGPRAAAEKRWGLAPLADPCRPLLYTAAFLAPCCGWLPIGDYRTFIILVAAVLLVLLWNFYRLGAPASATSPGEALPAGHNAALPPADGKGLDRRFLTLWLATCGVWSSGAVLYVILPSIDTHLFGKDDINYWFSWYAVNMAALTLLERKGYHRRAGGSAMTGLLLMAAAIIIIVCATGQVSLLLLAVAIQTAGSHIAFGYLYQQALNVCYRGRMMLYLSLLSLAGALGEGGALAVYWLTGNARFTLLLILLLLLLGVVILRLRR